jgi:hypothetical protein
MPVAVLITTAILGVAPLNMKTLGNVSFIVIGVVIASMGEIQFVMTGFLFQAAGIAFEAVRLVMVQRLLSSAEFKMDPLVSLYYYAPACACMNAFVLLFTELPKLTMADIDRVGGLTLFANALVAFMLNVSVVFLIGKTSSLVLTLSGVLKDILLVFASMFLFKDPAPGIRIRHCARRPYLLQAWCGEAEGIHGTRQHEVAGAWPYPPHLPQVDSLCGSHHGHVHDSRLSGTPLRP